MMINSGAIFSECRKYRYILWRIWDTSKPNVAFIGLNPSTADETKDDPTIRRCIGYAKAWGYGGMEMLNIFAYRATDPKEMMRFWDPVGEDNDYWLLAAGFVNKIIVAAWGSHGKLLDRSAEVIKLLPNLFCLKKNKDGAPAHPLYLRKNLSPMRFMEGA